MKKRIILIFLILLFASFVIGANYNTQTLTPQEYKQRYPNSNAVARYQDCNGNLHCLIPFSEDKLCVPVVKVNLTNSEGVVIEGTRFRCIQE